MFKHPQEIHLLVCTVRLVLGSRSAILKDILHSCKNIKKNYQTRKKSLQITLLFFLFVEYWVQFIIYKVRKFASDGNSWRGAQPSWGWSFCVTWHSYVAGFLEFAAELERALWALFCFLSLLHRKSNVWWVFILHFHSLLTTTYPWSAARRSVIDKKCSSLFWPLPFEVPLTWIKAVLSPEPFVT